MAMKIFRPVWSICLSWVPYCGWVSARMKNPRPSNCRPKRTPDRIIEVPPCSICRSRSDAANATVTRRARASAAILKSASTGSTKSHQAQWEAAKVMEGKGNNDQ
jgi:hypothetical protein